MFQVDAITYSYPTFIAGSASTCWYNDRHVLLERIIVFSENKFQSVVCKMVGT